MTHQEILERLIEIDELITDLTDEAVHVSSGLPENITDAMLAVESATHIARRKLYLHIREQEMPRFDFHFDPHDPCVEGYRESGMSVADILNYLNGAGASKAEIEAMPDHLERMKVHGIRRFGIDAVDADINIYRAS